MSAKRFLIFIYLLCVGSVSYGQGLDFSRGDNMIVRKEYSEAAGYFKRYAGKSTEARIKLSRCYYFMKQSDACVQSYANAPQDSLKDVDLFYLADMLWQLNKKEESQKIGAKIKNQVLRDVVAGFEYIPDTLMIYNEQNVTVQSLDLNPKGNAFGPHWHKGKLYYIANSKEPSLIDDFSTSDSSTYLDVAVQGGETDLPLGKMNSARHEGSFAINNEGNRMIITRTMGAGLFSSVEQPQLFELTLNSKGKWSRAKRLKFTERNFSCAHAAFSEDGKTLFFSSNMSGGQGGYDLYAAKLGAEGWGDVKILSNKVNSPFDELFATVSDDYLFYSSNRQGGLGAFDLYAWHRKMDVIEHLPTPINSKRDDFAISDNGTDSVWFVSSNRNFKEGKDEILELTFPKVQDYLYVYDEFTNDLLRSKAAKVLSVDARLVDSGIDNEGKVPPFMKNGDSLFVYGYYPHKLKFEDKSGLKRFFMRHSKNKLKPIREVMLNVSIPKEVADVIGDKTYQIENSDGGYKKVTSIQGETNVVAVLPFDQISEGDSIKVSIFKGDALIATSYQVVSTNNIYRASAIGINEKRWESSLINSDGFAKSKPPIRSLKSIYFATNKWFISPAAKKSLAEVVAYMKENPTAVIECASHADCRSSREYNLRLSEHRAKSTAEYIVKKGIAADRVKYKGYGEDKPVNGCICDGRVVPNCNPADLQLNRRTDFILLSK
jgi:outer membrane protein OmpA-like peptidoglycan-associated protein